MCTVSMVTDWGINTWPNTHPNIFPTYPAFIPNKLPDQNTYVINNGVSKEEFESFRKEFLEFKKLVQLALEYDKKNNEPHCEVDEKVAIVKKVAEQLGVTMDDVFPE